ncbi:MAG TPA: hypothetical protein VIH82_04555 [Acidimicrobiia bacterium]
MIDRVDPRRELVGLQRCEGRDVGVAPEVAVNSEVPVNSEVAMKQMRDDRVLLGRRSGADLRGAEQSACDVDALSDRRMLVRAP